MLELMQLTCGPICKDDMPRNRSNALWGHERAYLGVARYTKLVQTCVQHAEKITLVLVAERLKTQERDREREKKDRQGERGREER